MLRSPRRESRDHALATITDRQSTRVPRREVGTQELIVDHSKRRVFRRAAVRPSFTVVHSRLPAGKPPLTLVRPGLSVGKPPLQLTLAHRPGVVVLDAAGEIDLATAPALSEVLADAIARRPPLLVVDLTSTTFLACAGLSALVAARHLLGARSSLAVVAGSRATWRPLHITEVDRILAVYRCLDDALIDATPIPQQLVLRTVVADAAILVTATGGTQPGDTAAVTSELRHACELCRGVVLFDVSACTLPVADIVRTATTGAGPHRHRVRVLTADQTLTEALDAAGIAHCRSATANE